MNFTSNRKITIAGGGHVVSFEKGESKALPPSLHRSAMEQGLEADGEVDMSENPDEVARIDAIRAAMKAIGARNDTADFDAAGCPKMTAIEALTGGAKPLNAKERQSLWAEVSSGTGE